MLKEQDAIIAKYQDILARLYEGITSAALEDYPQAFRPLYCDSPPAGTGDLEALTRFISYQTDDFVRKNCGASIPCLLLVIGFLVSIFRWYSLF